MQAYGFKPDADLLEKLLALNLELTAGGKRSEAIVGAQYCMATVKYFVPAPAKGSNR